MTGRCGCTQSGEHVWADPTAVERTCEACGQTVTAQRPVVVVVGDPVNGYSFHGPALPNSPELEAFTDTRPICNETWWYAELEPIPGADAQAGSWADVVEDFIRWKLSPWEAQNLVRLAAAAVDSGEIGERGQASELNGFSDPDGLVDVAVRTWDAIRYLGDGEPGVLVWESAGTDEAGDENADSGLIEPGCTSMYWSLGAPGPRSDGRWSLELIGVDHGDEVPLAGRRLGHYATAELAKLAAQAYERTGEVPGVGR